MQALLNFLGVVGSSAMIGVVMDFLLSKSEHAQVRVKLEYWAQILGRVVVKTFSKAELDFTADFLKYICGKFISWQRGRMMLIVVILGTCAWLIASQIWVINFKYDFPFDTYSTFYLFASVVNLSISISFTIWSIQKFSAFLSNRTWINLFLYSIILLIQVILFPFLFELSLYWMKIPWAFWSGDDANVIWVDIQTSAELAWTSRPFHNLKVAQLTLNGWAGYVSSFMGLIPTIVRFGLGLFFLISVLFRPIYSIVVRLVLRLSESEKPIFALIFGAIAFAAKGFKAMLE
jgi:hypothetical protein